MKVVFLALVAAMAVVNEPVTVDDIDSAIRWLTRGAPLISSMQRDGNARARMAEAILDASKEFRHDPYRLTSVAFHESWFEVGVIGKAGEIGAMQVKGEVLNRCKKDGLDMSTARGQIRCGARHLRERIDHCGNIRDGMASYIVFRCSDKGIKKKVNSRMILGKRLSLKPWGQ